MNADIPHILVVDDDDRLRELLRKFLSENGFLVATASDVADARTKLHTLTFDLIVLDLMMPGESGLDFAEDLRRRGTVPTLMLTAMGEPEDRIAGLERGADDYLPKPFEPRELVARIQNILKRSKLSSHREQFEIGDTRIDLIKKLVQKNGETVEITATEFSLLALLIQNQNRIFSRDEIMNELRGIDAELYSRAIDVLVSRLRHKLQRPELIRTIRGAGYQFVSR